MTNNIKNLTVNELASVNGGTGVNIYAGYSRVWTKVMGACMQHDYRTAKCPVCGTPLPKLTHRSAYTEEEMKLATEEDKLFCHNCNKGSAAELWVINSFN